MHENNYLCTNKGLLVLIEGIDFSGKTTQSEIIHRELCEIFTKDNVELVHEPGGTPFGNSIKEVIMSDVDRTPEAEMFAFLAAKASLYHERVLPALRRGKIVISDRGHGSFLSYQSIMTGMSISQLTTLMNIACCYRIPDIVFLLDIDPAESKRRMNINNIKLSRFDKLSVDFMKQQRERFMQYADGKNYWHVIDATASIQTIGRQVLKIIRHVLATPAIELSKQ